MWRCRQAVQTTAQRWLRRNTSPHVSVRLYNTSACSSTAFGQSSLLNRPSILSGSDSHPSLERYGDVRTSNHASTPYHAFSTRRPPRRVPQMRDFHSVDKVIVIAYKYLGDMDRRDVSAVWARIAKLMKEPQSKQQVQSSSNNNIGAHSFQDMKNMLRKIFDNTANGTEQCDMKALTETIFSMAKIVKILRQQGKSKGEDSSREILRRLLLSKDMKPNRKIFQFFGDASMDILDQYDARCLSNLAFAYALIDYVPEFDDGSDLFDHIAMCAVDIDIRTKFNAQDIANMAWAYATLDIPHAVLFEALGDQIVANEHLGKFNPLALANTVWAYAKVGIDHPELFEKLANHIVKTDSLDRFYPQALSNIMWAYATARVHDPKLFQKVAEAAIQRKEEFDSQAVANLLWAYATMGITDKKLFSSFVPTAANLNDSYTNQGLANIAWAYAVADIDAPTLFNDAFINTCVENKDGFFVAELRQLYQWHLWQTKEKCNPGLPVNLQECCHEAFLSRVPRVSKFQDDVLAQLSYIGLDPQEEVLVGSGYRIDAIVEVNGKQVGIEVDGPSHFVGNSKSPTGSTILKRRQVPLIDGIERVSVPYWKWDEVGKDQAKKQEYLRNLLSVKSDK
eukprot:scaffold5572_cov83-Skeletonema_dohrnii-CCMP3373.AAC.2